MSNRSFSHFVTNTVVHNPEGEQKGFICSKINFGLYTPLNIYRYISSSAISCPQKSPD